VRTEARRDDMAACIHWLAEEPARYRRAMRRHRPGSGDQCLDRCGRWPCLTFEMAIAARNVHETQVLAAERLSDYPTQPMPAVQRSPGGHHAHAR
jgi:hypothetical protein